MRTRRRPIPLTLTTCCLCGLAAVAAWLNAEDSRTFAGDSLGPPIIEAIAPRTAVATHAAEADSPVETPGWSTDRLGSLLAEGVRTFSRLAGWSEDAHRTAAIASERVSESAGDERPVS